MKQLRLAIIGQGRSGRDIHGAFLRSDTSGQFKVVAVVDYRGDRRERALNEYEGCDVYEDYRELFGRNDIDLVINSTFSYLHYPVTLDLLEHGFNVVCEKPFAMHKADCEKMIESAEKNGVMLNVFQQSRFAPYFMQIRKVLESGVLGEIKQIDIYFGGFSRRWDWQCSQRWGGGSLYNTGPHPFDQALALLDFDPEAKVVYSRLDTVNTYGDAEDYVKFLLTAPNKPLINVEITSTNAYQPWIYLIQGQNGTLKANGKEIDYKYIVPADEAAHEMTFECICKPDGTPAYCSEKLKWHEEHIDVAGTAFDSAVKSYYDMIYQYLVNGRPMEISPRQSMQQIGLAEQIHKDNPLPIRF